ncbi:hypothetical protein HK099_001146 [Clydaea vesicula]|uniref:Uncharacterized protein n=1 Tax=Clydaea vesicula TaxID=447962 RepID=A0AAD5UAP6_9FUNG|nr:hypothetical protein HK099_001146 [Clydaea vesicula]KAJ3395207.1 hypothetical protein HDU92_006104 [Lobulomyces angularis]
MTRVDYRNLAKKFLLQAPQQTEQTTKNQPKLSSVQKTPEKLNFLKYLKFKCLDVNSTLEFYQSLGMAVDLNTTYVVEDSLQHENEVGTTKTIMVFSYWESSTNQLPNDGESSDQIYLFKPTVTNTENSHDFKLMFEYTDTKTVNKVPVTEEEDNLNENKKKFGFVEEKHNSEYLVIYVHFLSRLIKRIANKGFEIVVFPIDISETKIAIIKDPNGMEIRLMELNDTQLGETGPKKLWFARIGFYTIPTNCATDTCANYEKLFLPKSKPSDNHHKIDKNEKVDLNKPNVLGFRVVDSDDFIVGLTRTQFFWMGTEQRSQNFTICFVQKKDMSGAYISDDLNTPNLKLVAIGFQVGNIDSFVIKARNEKGTFHIDEGKFKIPGLGTFQRLQDRINRICVESFTPGLGLKTETQKEKQNKTAEKKLKENNKNKSQETKINVMAPRFPSAGVIEVKGRYWEKDDDEEDEEIEEEKEQEKKESKLSFNEKHKLPKLPKLKEDEKRKSTRVKMLQETLTSKDKLKSKSANF